MPGGRAFWQALAIVLVAHAVLLTQLAAAPDEAPRGRQGPAPVLPVRPVLPASAQSPATAAAPEAAPTAASEAATAPRPQVAAAAAAPLPTAPPADPWAGYLPRGELTEPPRPLASIQVPFPPDVEGLVELKVRISLFIDEDGVVRRVRLDTPDVPPMFARSVVETFERARFSPGRQGPDAVRSQLRLEVEFDSASGRR